MTRSVAAFISRLGLVGLLLATTGCEQSTWNSPYKQGQSQQDILYSSFGERPKHLDPARSYSANEWAFISQIYEPPLQYHFFKRPYALVPLSAEAMPEQQFRDVNGLLLPQDAEAQEVAYTDYVITIKEGIRYQPHPAFAKDDEGRYLYWPIDESALTDRYTLADFAQNDTREVVADDYVYQIKRLAFSPNHSPVAGLMAEHIAGFGEFSKEVAAAYKREKSAQKDKVFWFDLRDFEMSGVEVIDKYRYRIRINNKYPQFNYWLAMNFFAPMPWQAERFYQQQGMDKRNINLHWYPVGTGPFMLTENNPNLRMVLSRNPNFRGELFPSEGSDEDKKKGLLNDANKPMPFIEKAIYSLEKEAIPRWNKFLQGYYDNSGIGSDSFDQAVQFGAGGEAGLTDSMLEKQIGLSTAVNASIFYTGFNMKDSVVGGDSQQARLLRRAIAIAVDYEEFISIFRNGRGDAAHSALPPGIFGHLNGREGMNSYLYEWRNGEAKRKSIEQAKALLDQAGYGGGRDPATGGPLILYFDTPASGPDSKAMLQWYRKQFEKIGIELVVRSTDYNRFQEKMLKGTAQIFSWGWNADYPDPENFFFLLYGPNGKVDLQGENASNYSNPEFDALFVKMKDMANSDERMLIIKQMTEILRKDSPWLFGFYPKSYSLHHAWYKNAKPHLMANNTLKYKRVDGKFRAERQAEWNKPTTWPLWGMLLVVLLIVFPAFRGFKAYEKGVAK